MAPEVKDYRDARQAVDARFAGMSPVHTVNNACLTVWGLTIGGRDVTRVIGETVAMGLDNDCTAATAGSLVGAVQTFDGKPAAAKITIQPGGHATESGSDGRFEIKLPAGTYTVTAELEGHVARPMKVELKVPGPVVIINIDLRKQ